MKQTSAKRVFRSILMVLALALTFSAVRPIQSQAAVKKLKWTKADAPTARVKKRATLVKRGNSVLQFKKGYVKFTPKRTKTFRFTFSGLKTANVKEKDRNNAFAIFGVVNKKNQLLAKTVSTKGGTTRHIQFTTAYSHSLHKNQTVTAVTPIAKRAATLKLQKGQTVYIYLQMLKGTGRVKLNIR